jgi:P-type Ca2+ transporter type 2C
MPEEREVAFDAESKMMATFNAVDGRYRVAVKGALEAVLAASTRIATRRDARRSEREDWQQREALAAEGLRIIALAHKTVDDAATEPYADLTFLGLAALVDPPREDVRAALETARRGHRVVMVTGDQPATARYVAQAVGLVREDDAPVVHRPGPEGLRVHGRGANAQQLRARAIFARVEP